MSGDRRVGSQKSAMIGLVAVCLFAPASAQSQPDGLPGANPLAGRLTQLEQRVRDLETRLATIERSGGAAPASKPTGRAAFPVSDRCEPPYTIDKSGIKRFKPECSEALNTGPCDPPFLVDSVGIKRLKRECMDDSR